MGFELQALPFGDVIQDVTFPCPRCGLIVSVRNDGGEILHAMPPCERWLSVETLADAAGLLREHNEKAKL